MKPELSIVVATRDRPNALRRCLRAVASDRAELALEVLVVDDGSRDTGATAEAVATMPAARLLVRPAGGVAAARNAGVEAARGDFVCFLDDDCEPEPGWAASMARRFALGATAVVGPVLVPPAAGPAQRASQLVANSIVDSDAATSGRTASAPGTNLACRADVLRSIPFDDTYAEIGAEDRDWCARMATAGYELVFDPGAAVVHRQALTLAEFLRRQMRYGRGARVFRARHSDGRLAPPRFYARIALDAFRGGVAVGALVLLAQVATATGYLRQRPVRPEGSGAGRISGLSRRTASRGRSREA